MAKILLVDDDPDFVEATKIILEHSGFSVIVAYDGVEGMAQVKKESPDLIVLDVMMPQENGYELCKELKDDPSFKNIPVILLTSVASHISDTDYTRRQGEECEAEDYIDKPVEPAELKKRIEFLLSKQ